MRRISNGFIALSVLVVVGMVGCGDDGADAADAALPVPTVTLAATNTTVAAGGDLMVTVAVTNFILEAAVPPNVAGHGHYHIYLDGATGADYLVNDFAAARAVTIPAGTAAGAHTLRIELFENDHTALGFENTLAITVN